MNRHTPGELAMLGRRSFGITLRAAVLACLLACLPDFLMAYSLDVVTTLARFGR